MGSVRTAAWESRRLRLRSGPRAPGAESGASYCPADRALKPSRARMIRAMDPLPARVRLVIFDLDGVVYRGAEPIAGAADLVAWLHERGVPVRFATNNSMVARAGYVERLAGMGIPTAVE